MEAPPDSPGAVPDTPTDGDDGLYPCKGCGEILEEGKAFELAGNRWHINCFRCNTCSTLLDSDANLLLLGDGSLICNNCTYSCSACGNKIEDLAILTGQEAFCAQCFKCRNCKKKIDNLRYARTSQGIFCMQCHESLMARRRKKSRTPARATSANSSSSNPAILDKSLPALPPHLPPAGPPSESTHSPASLNSETPTERSPALRQTVNMKNMDLRTDGSGLGLDTLEEYKENLGLPDNSHVTRRVSEMSSRSNGSYPDDDNYIPVTLDTKARPSGPCRTISNENSQHRQSTQAGMDERGFNDLITGSAPRSGSLDRGPGSPHIMQQAMPRQSSNEKVTGLRRRNGSIKMSSPTFDSNSTSPQDRKPASPSSGDTSDEHFILQDVPRARRRSSSTKRGMNGSATSPNMTLAGQTEGSAVRPQETHYDSSSTPSLPNRKTSTRQRSPLSHTTTAPDPFPRSERPERTDSLERSQKPPANQAIPRKQLPRIDAHTTNISAARLNGPPDFTLSDTSFYDPLNTPATATKTFTEEGFEPPPRSSSRPTPAAGLSSAAMGSQPTNKMDFTSPRDAPHPPPIKHKPNESVSSIQSEKFLARDGGAPMSHDHTMYVEAGAEDEFGHMGSDESMEQNMFRKVSKVMRHGRSYSDKGGSGSPRYTKGSRSGSIDISSPIMGSNEHGDDSAQLRNKLRFSQQRVSELEFEKKALQDQVNGVENIRQYNTELREKRHTMTFLDTQREMIMRELETMTEQLAKAKESKGPIDIEAIKNDALRDFANQLQKLKDSVAGQIGELMEQKNQLTKEITSLIQMKDKGFQEYESLHAKNQQLSEHNNHLVRSIQDIYRGQKQPSHGNALGISTGNATGVYNGSLKDRQGSLATTMVDDTVDIKTANLSMDRSNNDSQMSGETEIAGESARVVEGPRVIDMRKGKVNKFSWKKGSENMAKNMKKGIKGAFASTQQPSQSSLREESYPEGVPYGQLQAGEAPVMGDRPAGQRNGIEAQRQNSNQGWGLLKGNNAQRSASHAAMAAGAPPDTLFGSDLSARCEYEGRVIPSIVSRCIEEVEQRGMDMEGIYRKSGSYSQVKFVQGGFEKDSKLDVSDEDLDIHSVTSVLKQYLRKLPMPLITYDAYEEMVQCASAVDEQGERVLIEGCARAANALPEHHRNLLEYLIGHLSRVMEHERDNKMTATNLAVVFAPTIMRPQSVDREMSDMEPQRKAVVALITNYRAVFAS